MNLCLAVVITAGYREPTMGAQVVGIEMDRGYGVTGTCRSLLVKATEKMVSFMPLKERLEECSFRQRGAYAMVVAAQAIRSIAAPVPQFGQPRHDVIAHLRLEGRGEAVAPRGQRRQFILERPDDHVAKIVDGAALKLAVHTVKKLRAGIRAEVIKPAAYCINQANALELTAGCRYPAPVNGQGYR